MEGVHFQGIWFEITLIKVPWFLTEFQLFWLHLWRDIWLWNWLKLHSGAKQVCPLFTLPATTANWVNLWIPAESSKVPTEEPAEESFTNYVNDLQSDPGSGYLFMPRGNPACTILVSLAPPRSPGGLWVSHTTSSWGPSTTSTHCSCVFPTDRLSFVAEYHVQVTHRPDLNIRTHGERQCVHPLSTYRFPILPVLRFSYDRGFPFIGHFNSYQLIFTFNLKVAVCNFYLKINFFKHINYCCGMIA